MTGGCADLIVDFKRVSFAGGPARRLIEQAVHGFSRDHKTLTFSGGAPDGPCAAGQDGLRQVGLHVAADPDAALEHAEDRRMKTLGTPPTGRNSRLAAKTFPKALRARWAALERIFVPFRHDADGHIGREGDRAAMVNAVARASLRMSVANPDGTHRRPASVGCGQCSDEIALVDSGRRTADVFAQRRTICYGFLVDGLRQLAPADPDVSTTILGNMVRSLAQRLGQANLEIRALLWRGAVGVLDRPASICTRRRFIGVGGLRKEMPVGRRPKLHARGQRPSTPGPRRPAPQEGDQTVTKRTSAKYKIDRRMGENIWGRPKSPVNRREYGPGQHGQRRKGKMSDFGLQLRAKQKLKGYYGDLTEKQFRGVFAEAERVRGDTGENLIALLERRLDTVVYRAKFVATIFAARQFVNHGHVEVNGKRVNIPSYRVSEGDVISVRDKSRQMAAILEATQLPERDVPDYLDVDHSKLTATFVRSPGLSDVPYAVMMEPNLVIEYYAQN